MQHSSFGIMPPCTVPELLGLQRLGERACRHVRVHVERLARFVHRDGGDHRNETVACHGGQNSGVDVFRSPDMAEVLAARSAQAPNPHQPGVLAGQADGAAP
jgi:hypothetical protein